MFLKIYQTTPEVRRAFGTAKKTFCLSAHETVTYTPDSSWDGGSRTHYHEYSVATGTVLAGTGRAGFNVTIPERTLETGRFLVKTGTFCGKPSRVAITALETDLPAVLALLGNPKEVA